MSDHELFHEIIGEPNVRVRSEIVARGLKSRIDFRNIYWPEDREVFETLGGTRTPALWDGERLHEGEKAVMAVLRAMTERRDPSRADR